MQWERTTPVGRCTFCGEIAEQMYRGESDDKRKAVDWRCPKHVPAVFPCCIGLECFTLPRFAVAAVSSLGSETFCCDEHLSVCMPSANTTYQVRPVAAPEISYDTGFLRATQIREGIPV